MRSSTADTSKGRKFSAPPLAGKGCAYALCAAEAAAATAAADALDDLWSIAACPDEPSPTRVCVREIGAGYGVKEAAEGTGGADV